LLIEVKMKILVTGGAGYIGSHTCKIFDQSDIQPVVYDNLNTGHEWAVKWGPLVVGDLADYDLLVSTLKKYDVEGVIHFAANAYVGESMRNPCKYFQNNVVNTLNLLNARRMLVFVKSFFLLPALLMGFQKLCQFLKLLCRIRQIPTVSLNCLQRKC